VDEHTETIDEACNYDDYHDPRKVAFQFSFDVCWHMLGPKQRFGVCGLLEGVTIKAFDRVSSLDSRWLTIRDELAYLEVCKLPRE
jgi:hypothetical protein